MIENPFSHHVVTASNERVIGMDRVLGYHGGPTALLYDGDMVVSYSPPYSHFVSW
jgi:hypothetical protein